MHTSATKLASLYGVLAFVLTACGNLDAPRSQVEALPLVDAEIDLATAKVDIATAGERGWNYHRTGEADLNGDGMVERIVVTAEVETAHGRLAWNDGHNWQVYVLSADGEKTVVYAQRLQLGTLTLRITEGEGAPEVLLLEHLPDSIRIIQIHYASPGEVQGRAVFARQLDPRGDLASPRFP